jgi:hypothetical protein
VDKRAIRVEDDQVGWYPDAVGVESDEWATRDLRAAAPNLNEREAEYAMTLMTEGSCWLTWDDDEKLTEISYAVHPVIAAKMARERVRPKHSKYAASWKWVRRAWDDLTDSPQVRTTARAHLRPASLRTFAPGRPARRRVRTASRGSPGRSTGTIPSHHVAG